MRSMRRIWPVIGGLGGLLAIVGLVVAVSQLLQAESTRRSQDATQATMVAIMNAQLGVQREMATLQASEVRVGPTATAIAGRVVELKATQEALEASRRRVEPTITAAARVSDKASSSSSPMRSSSQLPGISAELLEFKKFENTITVKLRFTNSGEKDQDLWSTGGSYLLDEATHARYIPTEQSEPGTITLPAGGKLEVWAKYPFRQDDKPEYLTVVLPYGILFEHVKMP